VAQARRLSAIMFTDMVGFTALAQESESLAMQTLTEQRSILRGTFARYGGTEIKTIGDGFLVEFASALDAVRCGVAIQSAVRERNAASTSDKTIQVRIGIHTGDVIQSEGDIHGDAVNVASRLEPLAEPGGVCISDQVYHLIRNKLESPVESLGPVHLKNVVLPIEVFRVLVTPWERRSTEPLTAKVGQGGSPDKRRIAILPMANLSGESEQYFADGLTEELISSVCAVSGLRVISRTSAVRYKDTRKTLPEIGRELGVGSVLEGSARRSGDRVRISIKLIEVATDEHLWSEAYERNLEDVFSIQSDIAKRVSEALKVSLLPVEKQAIEKRPTANGEAHDLYLKGRYHWHKRTEKEFRIAIRFFEQAIEMDPKYALAYVGLADCYLGLCDEGCLDATKAYRQVQPLVSKALELDDRLAEAHATAAQLLQNYLWSWETAEKGFQRAIELNPNWSVVCNSYAVHLALRGRLSQAITEIKRAEELDPYSVGVHDCAAEIYRIANDYPEAIAECTRMLEIDPTSVPAFIKLGKTYLQQSMFDKGVQAMEQALKLSHGGLLARAYLAYAYGIVGRTGEARALIAELMQSASDQYVSPFNVAIALAGLKEKTATMEWLRKAYDVKTGALAKVNIDPMFDFLRSDPRFVDLQRDMGLVPPKEPPRQAPAESPVPLSPGPDSSAGVPR
jgi:adenylate cyclase